MTITIGSRGSQLALWQANWVKHQLTAAGYQVEIKIIKTTGDKLQSIPPAQVLPPSIAQAVAQAGTKGLFIKEIEEALMQGEIDVAVHSLKDLPTDQPEGLYVAAVPERQDARDVLISRNGGGLAALAAGSRVGTSSLRRQTQLRSLRRDLDLVPLRGNLDTRLRKLDQHDCDALVLAAAGVHRLGLRDRISAYFSFEEMCPAVGQGALAMEIRVDNPGVREAVAPLDDLVTHTAVRAEREVLRQLGGGCQVPIAAYALAENGKLRLRGVVANLDGSKVIRASAEGTPNGPEKLGKAVAEDLLRHGAQAVLDSIANP
jgi:hydroxymethylbilane synthase